MKLPAETMTREAPYLDSRKNWMGERERGCKEFARRVLVLNFQREREEQVHSSTDRVDEACFGQCAASNAL